MRKMSLLALLVALMMILSGCALVTVDEEKDSARVIVDVNGETVTKGAVSNAVVNQIYQYQQYNQLIQQYNANYGYNWEEYPTDVETVTKNIIDSYVNSLVSKQKAAEMGMTQFTEEEEAEAQEHAQSEYDSFVKQITDEIFKDSNLEGVVLTAAVEKYIQNHGLSTLETYLEHAREEISVEKLEKSVTDLVTVTEEDIEKRFNELVESDKAKYTEQLNSFGDAVNNGGVYYYIPAGYRMVKHILIGYSEEDTNARSEAQTALSQANAAMSTAQVNLDTAAEGSDKAALETALNEAKAAVEAAQKLYDDANAAMKANALAKAEEVLAKATAEGADFDALIKEYSTDTGMPENGYAICKGYTNFVTSFTEGALGLEKVGDVTEPVESDYGYHLIQFASELEEGPVALDSVRDSLTSSVKSEKENIALSDALEQWKKDAVIHTYPDRMN